MNKLTVALAGNPNVGKSTLFNALTGLRQHTGNWAGKTVSLAEGTCRKNGVTHKIVDLPGAYSLSAASREEEIARDYIASGAFDAVIAMADASSPDRGVAFALQILELTPRVVLCLNLTDEAARRSVRTDSAAMSRELGIPVVEVSARRKTGIGELLAAAAQVSSIEAQPADGAPRFDHMRRAEEIVNACVVFPQTPHRRDTLLDKIFTGAPGIIVMCAVLAVVLWITLSGANYPSDALFRVFAWGEARLLALFTELNAPEWLSGAAVSGVYRTVAWVVSVMLPPMGGFKKNHCPPLLSVMLIISCFSSNCKAFLEAIVCCGDCLYSFPVC